MPAGPEPTTATACPVSRRGGWGVTQPSVEGAVDDRVLDLFDRDRVALADLEHARGLARRGAQTTGELGKVVRRVQLRDRVLETVVVDEVVPVGDQVPERAAVVTEGHAAVHAAGALLAQLLHRANEQELLVIVRALGRVPVGDPVALDLQEAAELAHQAGSSSGSPIAWGAPTTSTAPAGRLARTPVAPLPGACPVAARASSSASSRSTRL